MVFTTLQGGYTGGIWGGYKGGGCVVVSGGGLRAGPFLKLGLLHAPIKFMNASRLHGKP